MKKSIIAILNYVDLNDCEKIINSNFELFTEKAFFEICPNDDIKKWIGLTIDKRKKDINALCLAQNIDSKEKLKEYKYLILVLKDIEFNDENDLNKNIFTTNENINNFISYLHMLRTDTRTSIITNDWLIQKQENILCTIDCFEKPHIESGDAQEVKSQSWTKYKKYPIFSKKEFDRSEKIFNLFNKENKTTLENKINKAIIWYSKCFNASHIEDKFLICSIALEFLLLKDNEDSGISNKFANRISYLITKRIEYLAETNQKDELGYIVGNIQSINTGTKRTPEIINEIDLKDSIYRDAKNLYDRRSKIVHNGDNNVSEEECIRFMFYLKISMLQILQLKEDNHYEKIDDIIKIIKEDSN